MSVTLRLRRQQILREVEGYLDLLFIDEHGPAEPLRRCVAQRALDTLQRLGPDELERSHAQFLRGQALRAMNLYNEAVIPLRQAAQSEPRDIHIWLALGWCYKRTSRIDLAIEALEQALSVDNHRSIVYYNLACYWSLARNKRQALSYLAQALAMDSHYRIMIDGEPDFDPIRSDPAFKALTTAVV